MADGDSALGQLLVERNLMTEEQLQTALEFQSTLGGDLRSIVIKLGYVKDSVLANLVASEEHVEAASEEITADMVDFEAVEQIPREVLEKHLCLPLRSGGPDLVLAMADPNDLNAIEEVQFLVNRSVEPAVATKHAIRKALNQLHELKRQAQTMPPPVARVPADKLRRLQDTPLEQLFRAYLLLRAERGELSVDDLLDRVDKLS
ncbi:MAG: hypothetical protein D6731_03650 [Planctomycetota bacterium]|nr:MAG: hypothetical protein D6731_03650 [Planctomycetota bacterium]